MPSLRRSRNDRCRLGPEPIGGNDVLPPRFMLLWMVNVVGLPDKFRLPDEFESVDVAIGADERIICLFCWAPDAILTIDRCFGDEQSREGDAITKSTNLIQFSSAVYFAFSANRFWTLVMYIFLNNEIECVVMFDITIASIITVSNWVVSTKEEKKESFSSAQVCIKSTSSLCCSLIIWPCWTNNRKKKLCFPLYNENLFHKLDFSFIKKNRKKKTVKQINHVALGHLNKKNTSIINKTHDSHMYVYMV